ncbi:MAG TPA: hypothetical protein PKN87_10665 [Syntrophomonadaceae bacterium]|nr:hypothetical protein [Syntrophomonadaceae bacterium]HPR92910.1 hypothetical protein [Syntrophomonadaceae bacterium]
MESSKAPLIRVGGTIIIIALLLYMPTREFLKMTFILGIPFVLFLVLMKKNKKYSFLWLVAVVCLFLVAGFYIYSLTTLPERIETRHIIITGEGLIADGKYDEAVANYRQLEKIGEIDKMNKKIARVEAEREADNLVEEARILIEAGNDEAAREVLLKIPSDTRAAQEAVKLLRELNN